MYTPKPTDRGILYTGLSNYRAALEKDLPAIHNAIKYNKSFETLLENHKKTIKRIDEILEEL